MSHEKGLGMITFESVREGLKAESVAIALPATTLRGALYVGVSLPSIISCVTSNSNTEQTYQSNYTAHRRYTIGV